MTSNGGAIPITRALLPFGRLERSGPCWEMDFARGLPGGSGASAHAPGHAAASSAPADAEEEASPAAASAEPAPQQSCRRPLPLEIPEESQGAAAALPAGMLASLSLRSQDHQLLQAPLLDIDALKPPKLGSFGANSVYRTRHPKVRAPSGASCLCEPVYDPHRSPDPRFQRLLTRRSSHNAAESGVGTGGQRGSSPAPPVCERLCGGVGRFFPWGARRDFGLARRRQRGGVSYRHQRAGGAGSAAAVRARSCDAALANGV